MDSNPTWCTPTVSLSKYSTPLLRKNSMWRVDKDHPLMSRAIRDFIGVTGGCENTPVPLPHLLHLLWCSGDSGYQLKCYADSAKSEPPLSISKHYVQGKRRPCIMAKGCQRLVPVMKRLWEHCHTIFILIVPVLKLRLLSVPLKQNCRPSLIRELILWKKAVCWGWWKRMVFIKVQIYQRLYRGGEEG